MHLDIYVTNEPLGEISSRSDVDQNMKKKIRFFRRKPRRIPSSF